MNEMDNWMMKQCCGVCCLHMNINSVLLVITRLNSFHNQYNVIIITDLIKVLIELGYFEPIIDNNSNIGRKFIFSILYPLCKGGLEFCFRLDGCRRPDIRFGYTF